MLDVRADVGDHVAKGAVLARLDYREQRRASRAPRRWRADAANLQKARASVDKAKANFAKAKNINARRQTLVQSNITSVETAENSKSAEEAPQADVNLAKSDVAVAHAAIDDAKAQKQQETATFDFHTFTAPYDAMVIARQKELGSALAAGEPVFTIIDPKTVWVLAYIDESKAGEIEVGQPVEIVLRSQPNRRVIGRVARIEPESDRVNEERRVQIAFDRIPDDFNLGEQAEVYITTVQLAQAVLVPEAAIENLAKNAGTVWTVEDGRLPQRQVTLGHRLLDGRYEITGGLPDKAKWSSRWSAGCASAAPPRSQQCKPNESGVSRHQAQTAALRADQLRLEPAARHRDRHHRRLSRPDRRRATAGARRERRSLGGRGGHQRAVRRGVAHSRRYPREFVSRVYGVERAGAVTYQTVQTYLRGARCASSSSASSPAGRAAPARSSPGAISCAATMR